MKKVLIAMMASVGLSGCMPDSEAEGMVSTKEAYQMMVDHHVYPEDIENSIREVIADSNQMRLAEYIEIERVIRNKCMGGWQVRFLAYDFLTTVFTGYFPAPMNIVAEPELLLLEQVERANTCIGYKEESSS